MLCISCFCSIFRQTSRFGTLHSRPKQCKHVLDFSWNPSRNLLEICSVKFVDTLYFSRRVYHCVAFGPVWHAQFWRWSNKSVLSLSMIFKNGRTDLNAFFSWAGLSCLFGYTIDPGVIGAKIVLGQMPFRTPRPSMIGSSRKRLWGA